MFTKKSHHKNKNVYDILGKYISTDGYQLKIQLLKSANNQAANVAGLYDKNYDSIKCGKMIDTLKERGIYDINDVDLKDKDELKGRILKAADPGVTNVVSWTEGEVDDDMEIDLDELKGTDKSITNGEYHCSWFKGPYKILENRWREEYKVDKLFEELSKCSLKTSDRSQILDYLDILFERRNYEKILKYKHDKRRQKWRYKRLLGKRSYIDKLTNDLAYGIPVKDYGRERKTLKSDDGEPAIIIFGAANYNTSMRNYTAVPKKAILRVLAQKTTVLLINENNTTKKCFKCKENLHVVKETQKKRIGDRKFSKWSLSDLRNVRFYEFEKTHKIINYEFIS